MEIALGGKVREIGEPTFGPLMRIVAAYNKLAAPDISETDQIECCNALLAALTGGQMALGHLHDGELTALLAALPDLCGLERLRPGSPASPIDWDTLYLHIALSLGWDWDAIDQGMTMSRLRSLRDYQSKHPPTHLLVAAYLGYKPPAQSSMNDFLKAMAAQARATKRLAK